MMTRDLLVGKEMIDEFLYTVIPFQRWEVSICIPLELVFSMLQDALVRCIKKAFFAFNSPIFDILLAIHNNT